MKPKFATARIRNKRRILFFSVPLALFILLLALIPNVHAAITTPFTWANNVWCPSYHTYNGCTTTQSPSQFTVSFAPSQVSKSGSPARVSLSMNSTASMSGAFNTYGNEEWQPPITFTEKLSVPCNSSGKIENWPAFWAVGTVGSWPTDGEIDIFEGLGGNATWDYHYVNSQGQNDSRAATVSGNWCGTHTYSAKWTASSVTITWDGKQVGLVTSSEIGVPIVTDPMYIINDYGANPAVGGPTTPDATMKVLSFSAS